MSQQQQLGAAEPPCSARCPDTGLTDAEKAQRQAAASAWIRRVLRLMEETRCSAADALRAVELTDTEARR
jgi:hypothetical protein